ncbi:acyl-Coenzyme A oxidase [Chytridiales sp. JEL 0842]|nr:acyl-Coenzyme A oxidase [Chytridiales sp. JEL 0842]
MSVLALREAIAMVYPIPVSPKTKDLAYKIVERDALLSFSMPSDPSPHDLTRHQLRERTMVQIRRFAEYKKSIKDPELVLAIMAVMCELSDSFSMRIGVHDILFKTAMSFFGTDQQRDAILNDIDTYRVIGSFAMTELGHSSSLRDIETTATLDIERDEWVILSPTLTSTKWWMGMVGQTATHTVALAQTIIKGESVGLNWFLIPLRDPNTHRSLPGVTVGDLGSKAGREGLDNGFIQFTNVRIPRTDMLMRWCQVDRDGNVEGPVHPAVMYATLIPERLTLTFAVRSSVGKALTIALRYGLRRKVEVGTGKRVLDFKVQQVNLIVPLAGLYVIMLAERNIMQHWLHLQSLSTTSWDTYTSHLPDIHSTSAGLKAVVTWWASHVLENCRRACGGHAYSAYNSIAGIIADWGVMTTGGGDNYPMSIQCARYVVGCVTESLRSREGEPLLGSGAYLMKAQDILELKKTFIKLGKRDFGKLQTYIEIFCYLVVKKSIDLTQSLKIQKSQGVQDPWNIHTIDLMEITNLHIHIHLFHSFLSSLQSLSVTATTACLQPTFMQLATLFAADALQRHFLSTALEEGIITPSQAKHIQSTISEICTVILKDKIELLLDGLGFPDWVLQAPIGRKDGDMYQAYFDQVRKSTPPGEQTPYFAKEILPVLAKARM